MDKIKKITLLKEKLEELTGKKVIFQEAERENQLNLTPLGEILSDKISDEDYDALSKDNQILMDMVTYVEEMYAANRFINDQNFSVAISKNEGGDPVKVYNKIEYAIKKGWVEIKPYDGPEDYKWKKPDFMKDHPRFTLDPNLYKKIKIQIDKILPDYVFTRYIPDNNPQQAMGSVDLIYKLKTPVTLKSARKTKEINARTVIIHSTGAIDIGDGDDNYNWECEYNQNGELTKLIES
jgi:hypothetical protein